MSDISVFLAGPGDEAAWKDYVYQHPDAHFFHLIEWREILPTVYGYRPFYLMARNAAGQIVGVFPLFLVRSLVFGRTLKSLPFHFLGGLLASSQRAQRELIMQAERLAQRHRVDYLEVKTCSPWDIDNPRVLEAPRYTGYAVRLQADPEALLKSFKYNHRYSIRKAQRTVGVDFGSTAEHVETFYALHLLATRNLGLPPHAYQLFAELRRHFGDRGMMQVGIARHEGQPISAILLLLFRHTILYMWGASNIEYRSLCADPLLHWSAMKWGCENDYHAFDFGMTAPNEDGAHFYKSRWSSEPYDVYFYHFFTDRQPDIDYHTSFDTFKRVWRRLPMPVVRVLGPMLGRQAG